MKVEEMDIDEQIGEVGEVLGEREKKRGILIHVLQKIQEDNGFLPEDILESFLKH